MKTGVIIARFQVPYLHEGHKHLITEVGKKSDQIVFLLGSPSVPDIRNPLPYADRIEMIKENYYHEGSRMYADFSGDNDYKNPDFHFHNILDNNDDEKWSKQVDSILDKYEDVTLYGSRDCFHKHYKGKHPFEEISEIPGFSGTKIRDQFSYADAEDFRMGIIYGVTQLLKTQQDAKEKQERKGAEKGSESV